LFGHVGPEQPVWDLEEHSRAVTGEWVGPYGTTMRQIGERNEALVDDRPALSPFDIGNKPDAAGVMVEPGVIEPLSLTVL
jgi:hypothetical protein